MRTTVDIPDGLYRRLKATAAERGCSVKSLLVEAAAQVADGHPRKRGGRLRLPLVKSKRPGTLVIDNARIDELLNLP